MITWTLAFEESLQLAATSIAFCPDFSLLFSHKGWRGQRRPAVPPAPPAAGVVSNRPPCSLPGRSKPQASLPLPPGPPPPPPPCKCRILLGEGLFPAPPVPLAGGTRLYAGVGCSAGAGETRGFCCLCKTAASGQDFVKKLPGKNERKVAGAGETARGREGEGWLCNCCLYQGCEINHWDLF